MPYSHYKGNAFCFLLCSVETSVWGKGISVYLWEWFKDVDIDECTPNRYCASDRALGKITGEDDMNLPFVLVGLLRHRITILRNKFIRG